MPYWLGTGCTGDGTAVLSGGVVVGVYEIDAIVTFQGHSVVLRHPINPQQTYQVGNIELVQIGAFPPAYAVPIPFTIARMFVDAMQRIFSAPTTVPPSTGWGADTVNWHFDDSVVDVAVYW